jgi:AcrR family transcriptional regulator
MTRPSDLTRDRILKAAQRLFAGLGYADTGVRAVVAKARVNQASIITISGAKRGFTVPASLSY